MRYIVDLIAHGDTAPCDCIPDFFDTEAEARAAGAAEVARVRALIDSDADLASWDFAESFVIREAGDLD